MTGRTWIRTITEDACALRELDRLIAWPKRRKKRAKR